VVFFTALFRVCRAYPVLVQKLTLFAKQLFFGAPFRKVEDFRYCDKKLLLILSLQANDSFLSHDMGFSLLWLEFIDQDFPFLISIGLPLYQPDRSPWRSPLFFCIISPRFRHRFFFPRSQPGFHTHPPFFTTSSSLALHSTWDVFFPPRPSH